MRHMWVGGTAALLLAACTARAVGADELNVALGTNGATITADSWYTGSPDDTDRVAPPERLIDGRIRQATDAPGLNRWHSELGKPHPHWVWVHLARPAKIHRITLWSNDAGDVPVSVIGQYSADRGRSLRQLFARDKIPADAYRPALTVDFDPVVADSFRLVILRSSNERFPNYTQLTELQVFGQWAGEPFGPQSRPAPQRVRGELADGAPPPDLHVETTADAVTYTSPWLKVAFSLEMPAITFLSVDARGGQQHTRNLLKRPAGLILRGGRDTIRPPDVSFAVTRTGNVIRYTGIRAADAETDDLSFTVEPRGLQVALDRRIAEDYIAIEASPLRMVFDAAVTPASPMGRLKARGELAFPVLLHFPDYGSLLVRARGDEPGWGFAQRRADREVQLSLHDGWQPGADGLGTQQRGNRHTRLELQLTEVYPEKARVDADPKLAGVKRGWLNIFAFRPDIACLANNTVSDNCTFCVYEYADQAMYTPPLFDDFSALDLIRMTLDTYFEGQPGYGDDGYLPADGVRFMDVDPAVIIAAWDYATGKNDRAWLERRIKSIEKYAENIVAADADGDGMAESKRTGNSGIGPNGAGRWSSNWWDVISFGWKDAYCIALDYRAFRCMADLERRLGRDERATDFQQRADRIKAGYYSTFFNPKTGVLAGWKSQDGQLHDYYFTFVNGIAIAYGLVTREQGNALMDRMQAKMKEVGYSNFRIGLPGNLVPVARKDYAGGGVMGEPKKDDGGDSFQNYENGGATASFAYFYIQALYSLDRRSEADRILLGMLEGYRDGVFQNGVGSGVDWKRWDGTPCGYEGLLVDTYYALTAFITGHLNRGVPIP